MRTYLDICYCPLQRQKNPYWRKKSRDFIKINDLLPLRLNKYLILNAIVLSIGYWVYHEEEILGSIFMTETSV